MEPLEKGQVKTILTLLNPHYPKFLVDTYNSDSVQSVENYAQFFSRVYFKSLLTGESLEVVKKRLNKQNLDSETLTLDEMVGYGVLAIVEPLSAGFGGPVRNAEGAVLYYRRSLFAKTSVGSFYIFYNGIQTARRTIIVDGNTILNPGLTPITFNVDAGGIS